MKYLKILIVFCILLSGFSLKINGQNTVEIKIESVVLDENGDPIADALIYADEGNKLVYADDKGSFSVMVKPDSKLFIQAKGFQSEIVEAISGLTKIVLKKDNDQDKKVHVAFNTINEEDVSGAISILNPGDYINQDYNSNTVSGMNGRVAGLLWSNNIWGMENALVMIDGVPREFDDIRLDEIEQITVLKGVNNIALYGSHAAKGVILITSKRGEAYKREINVRANTGIATPKMYPNYLGASDYMTLYNEARANDGLDALYDETTIENYRYGNSYRYPDIDYYSSEYLNSYQRSNDVSAEFSGGNDNAKFYSNIGWTNNTSLLKVGQGDNDNYNRLNIRGNIDLKLNDFITSSIDVSVIFRDNRTGLADYWGSASTLLPNKYSPLVPIDLIPADSTELLRIANNSKNIIEGKYLLGGTQEYMTNPFADLYAAGYNKYVSRVLHITNGIDVDLSSVLKGLEFKTKFYADFYNSYNQSINDSYAVYTPQWSSDGDIIVGLDKYGTYEHYGTQNVSGTAQQRNLGISGQFNYLKTLNENHNITAILLGNLNTFGTNGVYQLSVNSNLGLQLAYNYDHKYYLDFSGSYVNSKKLAEGNRTAFSPTGSISWLVSNEEFLKNSDAVDFLKISASAGIVNTDLDITGYFLYDNIYSLGSYFSWMDATYSNQAFTSVNGANPNLSFAKRKEASISLYSSFFNRLLTFETNIFMNQMADLPTQVLTQYPSYLSDFVPYSNYNANSRSGADFRLGLHKQVGDFMFNLGAYVTYVTSEVVKKDELYVDAYQERVGKPVDAIFGLVSDGFFMDEEDIENSTLQAFGDVKPGDIKYVDQNGDNIIDSKDEVMIGRWVAPLTYSLSFSATYKSVTLFVQGTGNSGGNSVKTSDYYWVDGDDKYSEIVLNRWTEDTKTTATYPRLSSLANSNNYRYSDFWLYDTDRFNISKIQLTYDMPVRMLKKSFVRELGIYVNASNLLTLSKNKEILDLNISSAPQLRYYNVGVRANF